MVKKGGYQISLGMIVGVVFAVILLVLGISWIINMMKGIEGVSDSAISQAKSRLLQNFATGSKMEVLLAKDTLKANKKMEGAVVVANVYSKRKKFLVVFDGDWKGKFEITPSALSSNGMMVGPIEPEDAYDFKFTLKPTKTLINEVNNDDDKSKSFYLSVSVYECDGNSCTKDDDNLYAQKLLTFEVVA